MIPCFYDPDKEIFSFKAFVRTEENAVNEYFDFCFNNVVFLFKNMCHHLKKKLTVLYAEGFFFFHCGIWLTVN